MRKSDEELERHSLTSGGMSGSALSATVIEVVEGVMSSVMSM